MDSVKSIEDNNKDLFLSFSNFLLPESISFVIDTSFYSKILEYCWFFQKRFFFHNGNRDSEGGNGWLLQSPDHNYKYVLSNLENCVLIYELLNGLLQAAFLWIVLILWFLWVVLILNLITFCPDKLQSWVLKYITIGGVTSIILYWHQSYFIGL